MNGTTGDIDTRTSRDDRDGSPTGRRRLWWLSVNWLLALLTVPVAVVVLVFGIGAVMSTSGCSNHSCEGPSGSVFTVLFYGAPVIAALTIVASFFTARRGWGIIVPLCGLLLLGADMAVMAVAFRT